MAWAGDRAGDRPGAGPGRALLVTIFTPVSTDFSSLLAEVRRASTSIYSPIHGEAHWQAVASVGLDLAELTPGADSLTVLLFGLLHDCMRRDDGPDPPHGLRAAEYAAGLRGRYFDLDDGQWQRLDFALRRHSDGFRSRDPTVACSWDADRLDLWRVGVPPSPVFLSTAAARRPELLEAGRGARCRLLWPSIWARCEP
jgi:uncharacterized protein